MEDSIDYIDDSATLPCVVCKDPCASEGMNHMCPDCYWDAEETWRQKQHNPTWRFNRLCSLAVTGMGMDKTAAVAFASKVLNLDLQPTAVDDTSADATKQQVK
jgi:hypothetical protein